MGRTAQTEIPEHFANLWRVGGAIWEDPNAGRLCRATGYVSDEDGRERVHVVFVERGDLFDDAEATYTPWQLFPELR